LESYKLLSDEWRVYLAIWSNQIMMPWSYSGHVRVFGLEYEGNWIWFPIREAIDWRSLLVIAPGFFSKLE